MRQSLFVKQAMQFFSVQLADPNGNRPLQILRPEKGLLAIRKHFDLFANLRPVKAVPSLLHASPLKEEVAKDVDLLIVRELTGGLYFGEPSRRTENSAVDTLVYTREEITRIVEKGFELARLTKRESNFC